jgi:hypothetical protein
MKGLSNSEGIEKQDICYLCGKPIFGNPSRDHVPPRQFFGAVLRKKYNLNLLTLKTHKECNKAFQLDEEYFIHTFVPLSLGTYSGRSLLDEVVAQYQKRRNVPLSNKVLKEFDENPSDLILPKGKVVKRFDPDRVWGVVWKITRGLFFIEYERILPEDTPRIYKIVDIETPPPQEYGLLANKKTRGNYPGVFAYKYMTLKKIQNFHFWAMLFWDSIMVLVYFHDPECGCEKCVGINAQ